MAAVTLTISETLDGTAVADALAGGGSGVDLGAVTNNSFAPIIDKSNNQGQQDLYIRHDASNNPITDCITFIQEYGTGTAFSYGGADTAANDIAKMINFGFTSGSSKNNADGLSKGLWIDQDWDSNDTTRFDHSNFPLLVKIYGDNNTDGIDLASGFVAGAEAMVYDSGGETAAGTPVAGQVGKNGDTVLGDNFHAKLRAYLPDSATDGGIVQFEWVFAYSYTD